MHATHSDERNFKCTVRSEERSFKTKSQLYKHIVHHYKSQFSCTQCEQKCDTSSALHQHMNYLFEPTHEGNQFGTKFHILDLDFI